MLDNVLLSKENLVEASLENEAFSVPGALWMITTIISLLLKNPSMTISVSLTMIPTMILIVMAFVADGAGVQLSGAWWSDPSSYSDTIDSAGYVKKELIPLIIKLNEGLLRKIMENSSIAENNQSYLTAVVILLVVLFSSYVGYGLTQMKGNRRRLKEKEIKDNQINQLLEWRRMELLRRQNIAAPALPGVQLDIQNERNP